MVYLFLADGFEEIEALTPLDYLRRANVEIKSVALNSDKIVTGKSGIKVIADMNIDDVATIPQEQIEMIILPGGLPGTTNLENSTKVQEIITYCDENKKFIGAICAAPSILGHRGILKGKTATCYNGFETELDGAECTGKPVEVCEHIITARGAGVSNQFAFKLIEKLKGEKEADKVKSAVLY